MVVARRNGGYLVKKPGTIPIAPRRGTVRLVARDAMVSDVDQLRVERRVLKPPISTQGTEEMRYRYFVSYVYWVHGVSQHSYGNCCIDADKKILSNEELRAVERTILLDEPLAKAGVTEIVVLNFTLLD